MRDSSRDQPSPVTSTYSFAVSSKTKLVGRRRLNSAPRCDVWDSDMAAAIISERLFVRCFPPSRYRTRRAAAGILTILAEVRTLPALLNEQHATSGRIADRSRRPPTGSIRGENVAMCLGWCNAGSAGGMQWLASLQLPRF